MIKNILLVDPKQPKSIKIPGFNEVIEPIGLCYIASFIQRYGYKAKIIQQCSKTDKETLKLILDSKPDIVGFTAVTCVYPRARRFSKILRKKGILTVIGGTHATAEPLQASKDFDYVVIGEGEATFLNLINSINEKKDLRNICGMAFYSDIEKKTIINPRRERLNFEKQPVPSRDGLDLRIYQKAFAKIPPL